MLPIPVAQLCRRARNAKSPKERHDTAYFAWEASVRLAVAVGPRGSTKVLANPSTGDWVSACPTREDILDSPALLAAHRLFSEEGLARRVMPTAIRVRQLLEPIAAYRNRLIGHGSTREAEFYETAADVLLAGLEAAWDVGVFLGRDEALVWVESVDVSHTGQRRGRILELSGQASSVVGPREGEPVPDSIMPRRIYVRAADGLRTAHPWLLYEGSELRERVLFYNGRARAPKYLDFVSGEHVRGDQLAEICPTLGLDLDDLFSTADSESQGPDAVDPKRFGDYRILGKLGEGGMGVVYLASQESLGGRLVALKMLPEAASDDAIAVARFQREIAALSRCDHPNVVKILGSGVEHRTHYYSMEYVEGAGLDGIHRALDSSTDFDAAVSTAFERVRSARPEVSEQVPHLVRAPGTTARKPREPFRALCELFRDAARALHHLHELNILHRDIKPSNLMVTEGDHRVVVMDLGLAALGDASRTLTRDSSSILGTLRYMPPEQLQRNLLQVDRRADVYSLGATFYELFTGRLLFDGDSEARLIEQVLREDPLPPDRANPALPSDLCVILAKACEKDARRRYDTAEALAQDLDALMAGEPITARPPTLGYVVGLALRRHRGLVAALLFVMLAGLGGTVAFVARERSLRQREQSLRRAADLHQAEAVRQQGRVQALLHDLYIEQGAKEVSSGDVARGLILLAEAYKTKQHDPVVRFLLAKASRSLSWHVATLETLGHKVKCAAFDKEGSRVATGDDKGIVTMWDSQQGDIIASYETAGDPIEMVGFTNSETFVFATSRVHDLYLWDASSGAQLAFHRAPHRIVSVDVADQRLAYATVAGDIEIWTQDMHDQLWGTHWPGVRLKRVSLESPPSLWRLSESEGWDSLHLIVSTRDGEGCTWTVNENMFSAPDCHGYLEPPEEGNADSVPRTLDHMVSRMPGTILASSRDRAFSVDARGVGYLRLKNPELPLCKVNGKRSYEIEWYGFDKLGISLVTNEFSVLDLQSGYLVAEGYSRNEREHGMYALHSGSQQSNDRRHMIVINENGGLEILDVLSASVIQRIAPTKGVFIVAAISPDGRQVVAASEDGELGLWSARTGKRRNRFEARADGIRSLAFAREGKAVLGATSSRVIAWSTMTGQRIWRTPSSSLVRARLSPDGRLVATATENPVARVYSVDTGRLVTELIGHEDDLKDFSFSPEGRRLASVSRDGSTRVWAIPSGTLISELPGPREQVRTAAFAPDGRRAATGSADGKIRIWDTDNGHVLSELGPFPKEVRRLSFSPDGRYLVAKLARLGLLFCDVALEARDPRELWLWIDRAGLSRKIDGSQLLENEPGR